MQMVELVLDHDLFFCPVTGEQILSPESFKPSPATVFVFLPGENEFEFITEEFSKFNKLAKKKKQEEDDEDEDGYERFKRFSSKLKKWTNVVVFSLTQLGMACGPVSHTVYIGIDMNYFSEERDEG